VPPIRGDVFDAYGTLFDVPSVVEAWCHRGGAPHERLGLDPDWVVTSLDALPPS